MRLPAPGKTFEAVVGVDSNEQTGGGRGSVIFSVQIGGKEVFRSAVLKEGMPPVPVKIDLAGAKEFVLEVNDSGDGISCDQADWADAKITLADGRSIWLADLPMAGGPAVADPNNPPFSFIYDGQPSSQFLKNWKLERASKPLDPQRTQRTLTYTDPKTGLVVRALGSSTAIFPRSSGRCTSRTPARRRRRSSKTSKRSTCGSRGGTTASSCCTTRWAVHAAERLRAGRDSLAAEE